MPVRFNCQRCTKRFEVGTKYAGRRINCPFCGATIRIPQASMPAKIAAGPAPTPATATRPRFSASALASSRPKEPPASRLVEPGSTPPEHEFPPLVPPPRLDFLGIAALATGGLGLVLFNWPPVGLSFAGVGLVLAIVALFAALKRGDGNPGYAVGGGAASGLAMIVGIVIVSGGIPGLTKTASVKQASGGGKPAATAADNVSVWGYATKGALALPSAPDITVEVTRVAIGPVRFSRLGEEETSPDACLQIQLTVSNHSAERKIDFHGWSSLFSPRLSDDVKNPYKVIKFGSDSKIDQQESSVSVYPKKQVTDLLLFEPPVEGAKELTLELPGMNFGATGLLEFRIPRAMWTHGK